MYICLSIYILPAVQDLFYKHYVNFGVPFDNQYTPESFVVADATWLKAKPAALPEVVPSVLMARLPNAWLRRENQNSKIKWFLLANGIPKRLIRI